jgi:hypothetical protein
MVVGAVITVVLVVIGLPLPLAVVIGLAYALVAFDVTPRSAYEGGLFRVPRLPRKAVAREASPGTASSEWGAAVTAYLATMPFAARAEAEFVLRKTQNHDVVERPYVRGDREERMAREVRLMHLAGFDAEVETRYDNRGEPAYRAIYRRRPVSDRETASVTPSDSA